MTRGTNEQMSALRAGERGVDGGRKVDEARLRLVFQDVERERPDRAVPPDDVEGRDEGEALDEGVVLLDEDALRPGARAP